MGFTRRRFLLSSTAAIGAGLLTSANATPATPPSCYDIREYNQPTPTPPKSPSNDAVVAEAYGELALSAERPYWAWPVCSFSKPLTIEYEIRNADGDTPSVLVMDDTDFQRYRTKLQGHPIVEWPTFSTKPETLGPLGPFPRPIIEDGGAVNLSNIPKQAATRQSWKEGSPAVKRNSLECLNFSSPGPVHKRHTIEAGRYYVLFDWTDNVLHASAQDQGTVQVSLRAMHSVEDEVATAAPDSMQQLYTRLDDQPSALVSTAVGVAEAICTRVPPAFQEVSVDDLNATAPRAAQLTAAVKILLSILEDRFGYDTTVIHRLSEQTTAWTRWGLSVLPVASSIEQLLDDACAVAAAQPSTMTDNVENMLLSIGIVVADLVAAYYGVAGRAAGFATRWAHKYYLGYVARTLGLRTYLVLLRELFTLTLGGIRAALSRIKEVTRTIADEYRFIGDAEAETVRQMDREGLESVEFEIDVFSLNPECST